MGILKLLIKKKIHNELIADLKIEQKKILNSTTLKSSDEVPLQIDEIPILSIAASFANGLDNI